MHNKNKNFQNISFKLSEKNMQADKEDSIDIFIDDKLLTKKAPKNDEAKHSQRRVPQPESKKQQLEEKLFNFDSEVEENNNNLFE